MYLAILHTLFICAPTSDTDNSSSVLILKITTLTLLEVLSVILYVYTFLRFKSHFLKPPKHLKIEDVDHRLYD